MIFPHIYGISTNHFPIRKCVRQSKNVSFLLRRETHCLYSCKSLAGRMIKRAYTAHPSSDSFLPLYTKFQEETNEVKTKKLFQFGLECAFSQFGIEPQLSGSAGTKLDEDLSWRKLQEFLRVNFEYKLPSLGADYTENFDTLAYLFPKVLIKEKNILEDPQPADYIFTPSEAFWALKLVGIPFTRHENTSIMDLSPIQEIIEQCPESQHLLQTGIIDNGSLQKIPYYALLSGEKDATAAILLATPYLDNRTIVHEIGCWSGQNLLNLFLYASYKQSIPKYFVGTDINSQALVIGNLMARMLELKEPSVQFHLANALFPPDLRALGLEFDKEVRMALRLLPVLDPNRGKEFLQKTKNSLKNRQEDVVILSYAVPTGMGYKKNLERIAGATQDIFIKTEFAEGVVFQQKIDPSQQSSLPSHLLGMSDSHFVINTYYTDEGFAKLAQECGFKILYKVFVKDADNNRTVVMLRIE